MPQTGKIVVDSIPHVYGGDPDDGLPVDQTIGVFPMYMGVIPKSALFLGKCGVVFPMYMGVIPILMMKLIL